MKKIDLHKLDTFFDTHRNSLKFWFVLYLIGNAFDFWRKTPLDWLAHAMMALVFLYCARCVLVFFKEGKSGGNTCENVGDLCHLSGGCGSLFVFVYPIVLRKEESNGKTEITFIFRPSSLHPK